MPEKFKFVAKSIFIGLFSNDFFILSSYFIVFIRPFHFPISRKVIKRLPERMNAMNGYKLWSCRNTTVDTRKNIPLTLMSLMIKSRILCHTLAIKSISPSYFSIAVISEATAVLVAAIIIPLVAIFCFSSSTMSSSVCRRRSRLSFFITSCSFIYSSKSSAP